MSFQDPISDALTRLRNAGAVRKPTVVLRGSKVVASVLQVLADEGYIVGFNSTELEGKPAIEVNLKYDTDGNPVIENIQRVSKPSLRVYKGAKELPEVLGGLGVAVISTCKGVMSDRQARLAGVGGEVLCSVY